MFTLKAPLRLSWKQLYRQFGVDQEEARNASRVNHFRSACLRELKKINRAWPDLHYRTATGAVVLSPSPPRIPTAQLPPRGIAAGLVQPAGLTWHLFDLAPYTVSIWNAIKAREIAGQPSPTSFDSRGWDTVRPGQSLRRNTQHTWGGWPESRPVRVPPVCRHRSRTNAPESAHTSTATMSAGGASQPAGRSASAAFMNCAHRGVASSDAYPSVMIVRGWSNPIHTPAASSGVNPMNQASL